jgi:hypothetical protein
MNERPPFKPVVWVGSSREDLLEFSKVVKDHIGYVPWLRIAERIARGETP